MEASEPVRLLSTSPEFELSAHEANTVLEVLEIRAEQIGLPKAAAVLLLCGSNWSFQAQSPRTKRR